MITAFMYMFQMFCPQFSFYCNVESLLYMHYMSLSCVLVSHCFMSYQLISHLLCHFFALTCTEAATRLID